MNPLIELDRSLTLALNGVHAGWLDPVMLFFSKVYVWLPLYLAAIALLFWKLPWRKALIGSLMLIAAFAFTDIFTHYLKEHVFLRLRPCEDPALGGLVRLLEPHGSLYGFPSGHAANTFGFAAASAWLLKRRWWSIPIFCWAALVSYSRIYVGKHYLGDVLGGAVCGMLVAGITILLMNLVFKWIDKRCAA